MCMINFINVRFRFKYNKKNQYSYPYPHHFSLFSSYRDFSVESFEKKKWLTQNIFLCVNAHNIRLKSIRFQFLCSNNVSRFDPVNVQAQDAIDDQVHPLYTMPWWLIKSPLLRTVTRRRRETENCYRPVRYLPCFARVRTNLLSSTCVVRRVYRASVKLMDGLWQT